MIPVRGALGEDGEGREQRVPRVLTSSWLALAGAPCCALPAELVPVWTPVVCGAVFFPVSLHLPRPDRGFSPARWHPETTQTLRLWPPSFHWRQQLRREFLCVLLRSHPR